MLRLIFLLLAPLIVSGRSAQLQKVFGKVLQADSALTTKDAAKEHVGAEDVHIFAFGGDRTRSVVTTHHLLITGHVSLSKEDFATTMGKTASQAPVLGFSGYVTGSYYVKPNYWFWWRTLGHILSVFSIGDLNKLKKGGAMKGTVLNDHAVYTKAKNDKSGYIICEKKLSCTGCWTKMESDHTASDGGYTTKMYAFPPVQGTPRKGYVRAEQCKSSWMGTNADGVCGNCAMYPNTVGITTNGEDDTGNLVSWLPGFFDYKSECKCYKAGQAVALDQCPEAQQSRFKKEESDYDKFEDGDTVTQATMAEVLAEATDVISHAPTPAP